MSRAPSEIRKEARRLFLSGEMDTNADIAAHLHVKPHSVGRWRKEEGWDDVRRKAERHHAEKQAKSIRSKVVVTNDTHLKAWDIILGQLVETLYKPDPAKVKMLDRQAKILELTQRGQRLGRGLNVEGETEEKIRAESYATHRKMIDLFIDTVKETVPDEETRERIGQRLMAAVPRQESLGAADENQPGADGSAG
ncbi:MAG: hypothetical protein ACREAA_02710 [Candidatus Polarisedimenticolia bacterium]